MRRALLPSLLSCVLLSALTGCEDVQFGGTNPSDSTLDEGGDDGGDDGGGDDTAEPAGEPSYAPSTRADLRPKRWRQLSLDLEGALELAEDDICKETDRFQCTSLHVIPLGGISEDNGVYEPQSVLPGTAGLATERVVLQACTHRLEADRELQEADEDARVFTHIDLEGSELTEEAGQNQATELWRRLLMRDPSETELAGAISLHESVVSSGGDNAAWGVMLCLALGTSTEALTY